LTGALLSGEIDSAGTGASTLPVAGVVAEHAVLERPVALGGKEIHLFAVSSLDEADGGFLAGLERPEVVLAGLAAGDDPAGHRVGTVLGRLVGAGFEIGVVVVPLVAVRTG
jgi:hypothetical protein